MWHSLEPVSDLSHLPATTTLPWSPTNQRVPHLTSPVLTYLPHCLVFEFLDRGFQPCDKTTKPHPSTSRHSPYAPVPLFFLSTYLPRTVFSPHLLLWVLSSVSSHSSTHAKPWEIKTELPPSCLVRSCLVSEPPGIPQYPPAPARWTKLRDPPPSRENVLSPLSLAQPDPTLSMIANSPPSSAVAPLSAELLAVPLPLPLPPAAAPSKPSTPPKTPRPIRDRGHRKTPS